MNSADQPVLPRPSACVLTDEQIASLRIALEGRLIVGCFGSGVDSTAMLVALHDASIRPDVLTFADTGAEKPETLRHVERMNEVLSQWEWPLIETVRKVPLPSTGYSTLIGECLKNQTLPSVAFGSGSCSQKWKLEPQDQFLKGVKSGPNARAPHPLWLRAKETGQRIVKLIGYDCGRADVRRAGSLAQGGKEFDYVFPLQRIGWARPQCVSAIAKALGANLVPVKSACVCCQASKVWELFWLAAHHPELLEEALKWSASRSPENIAASATSPSARRGKTPCATPRVFPARRKPSGWGESSRGTDGHASMTWSMKASGYVATTRLAPASFNCPSPCSRPTMPWTGAR
jgi:hypothetical protein